MSWKRRNPEKPNEEDDEDILEDIMDPVSDVLEVDDSEYLDEEALLQGGTEEEDVDEGTIDDLLEGDLNAETRSARQREALGGTDIERRKSDTSQSTVELPVSPEQVKTERTKVEQGQPNGSGKTEGTQHCEDKPSATQSFGSQKSVCGESNKATGCEDTGRNEKVPSKKFPATESSTKHASDQLNNTSCGDGRRIACDKGEENCEADRGVPQSSRTSHDGRFSTRRGRPDSADNDSHRVQQSRRDSRVSDRPPYPRQRSVPHAGHSLRMPNVRPSLGTSLPSQPASGLSQVNQPAMLHGTIVQAIAAAVFGAKRIPEMPVIETRSAIVGPSGHSSLGCLPGQTSGALRNHSPKYRQPSTSHGRAGGHNPFGAASPQFYGDSKEAAQCPISVADGSNSSPTFNTHRLSCLSNDESERPAFFGSNDFIRPSLPSCDPHDVVQRPPNPEAIQERSSSQGRISPAKKVNDLLHSSVEAYANNESLSYCARAPRDCNVPKMQIDYRHGNGDCDYRIPQQQCETAATVDKDTPDLAEPGKWSPGTRSELFQDFARDDDSDCKRLERDNTLRAGTKRGCPSDARASGTMHGSIVCDYRSSTCDDAKRPRMVGSGGVASLQPTAASAGQSSIRVPRLSKNSVSDQDSSFAENCGAKNDEVRIETNSDEYSKKLQEQRIMRNEIMRRKEEQRRKEAECKRVVEMVKSKQSSASPTPFAADCFEPDANCTEETPRPGSNALQSSLPVELTVPPLRRRTCEASAKTTVAARVATVAQTSSSRRESVATRLPMGAAGTACGENVLLRERHRQLQLAVGQGKTGVKATPSTNAVLNSTVQAARSVASTNAAPGSPRPVARAAASTNVAPRSPLQVARGATSTTATRESPPLVGGIRTLLGDGNVGMTVAVGTTDVRHGSRIIARTGEPTSRGCDSAVIDSPAHREDLRVPHRPQSQWQRQERQAMANDSKPWQGRPLLVDYNGSRTEGSSVDRPFRRSRKVNVRNLYSKAAEISLVLAAAQYGKVMHVCTANNGTANNGTMTLEFESPASAESFCKQYNNYLLGDARISVTFDMS